MCKNALTQEKYTELAVFIEACGAGASDLISVLHKAQGLFGYLPEEVQLYIARQLKLPAAKVNGVVSFYSYFTETPKGERIISVCMGTACFVRGAEDILKDIESKLGIKAGGTTTDKKYSIDALRCVGACGLAPVVMVNEKVFGRVTKEDVSKILAYDGN
jgi:NADH-quinone oxidoreductase subunit E